MIALPNKLSSLDTERSLSSYIGRHWPGASEAAHYTLRST